MGVGGWAPRTGRRGEGLGEGQLLIPSLVSEQTDDAKEGKEELVLPAHESPGEPLSKSRRGEMEMDLHPFLFFLIN